MLKKLIKQMIMKMMSRGQQAEEGGQQVILVKPGGGTEKAEMDLRVVGLFSSVTEEKVAEIITGLIYLNEMNKIQEDESKNTPVSEKDFNNIFH